MAVPFRFSATLKKIAVILTAVFGTLAIVFVAPIGIDGQSWIERISSEQQPLTTDRLLPQAVSTPFGMTGGNFVAERKTKWERRTRHGGDSDQQRLAQEPFESDTGYRVAQDWLNDERPSGGKLEPIGRPIRNDYVVE